MSKGQSIRTPAPDILQASDSGQFVVTADRVSFIGSMFSRTITPDKVAGYEASGRRIVFAAKNSTKIWVAQFATGDDFVLATSAVIVWDELYTRLARTPGAQRAIVGPPILDWLLSELVGEHPSEIWALRRLAHLIELIANGLARQHRLLMIRTIRDFRERDRPRRIVVGRTEACWSCNQPLVLSNSATCSCGGETSALSKRGEPYLSEIVNCHRTLA